MKNSLFQQTFFDDVLIGTTDKYIDNRGAFLEIYKSSIYDAKLLNFSFVQDNISISKKNVLRGLHYQVSTPQAQLLTVIEGSIFDVTVDLRINSKTFGEWQAFDLSDNESNQLFMAPGIAHGFLVKSKIAILHYKVSEEYNPQDEEGINWKDPKLAIPWPSANPILKERDSNFPHLTDVSQDKLPQLC